MAKAPSKKNLSKQKKVAPSKNLKSRTLAKTIRFGAGDPPKGWTPPVFNVLKTNNNKIDRLIAEHPSAKRANPTMGDLPKNKSQVRIPKPRMQPQNPKKAYQLTKPKVQFDVSEKSNKPKKHVQFAPNASATFSKTLPKSLQFGKTKKSPKGYNGFVHKKGTVKVC